MLLHRIISNHYSVVVCGVSFPPTCLWCHFIPGSHAACSSAMQHIALHALRDTPSLFNHGCSKAINGSLSPHQHCRCRGGCVCVCVWLGGAPEKQKCNLEAAVRGMTQLSNRLPSGSHASESAHLNIKHVRTHDTVGAVVTWGDTVGRNRMVGYFTLQNLQRCGLNSPGTSSRWLEWLD